VMPGTAVSTAGCSVFGMADLFIGLIWLVVLVGGVLGLSALVAMAKAPYRNK